MFFVACYDLDKFREFVFGSTLLQRFEMDEDFVAEMRVDVANQRGVLATLAAIISDMGSNIENVDIEERDGMTNSINFTLTVKNRDHLAKIMRRAKGVNNVMRISRKKS
mgnify:CR=1 FL=1